MFWSSNNKHTPKKSSKRRRGHSLHGKRLTRNHIHGGGEKHSEKGGPRGTPQPYKFSLGRERERAWYPGAYPALYSSSINKYFHAGAQAQARQIQMTQRETQQQCTQTPRDRWQLLECCSIPLKEGTTWSGKHTYCLKRLSNTVPGKTNTEEHNAKHHSKHEITTVPSLMAGNMYTTFFQNQPPGGHLAQLSWQIIASSAR